MSTLSRVLSIGVVVSVVFHLLVSPYTKVEESFNIQAIHDILEFGISPNALVNYDHQVFPGVVPRTFLASLLIAGILKPITAVLDVFHIHLQGIDLQVLARLIIGLANAYLIIKLSTAINSIDFQARKLKTKSNLGTCFLWLVLSQFHLLYYASRSLPNFLALPFVNYGFAKIIVGDVTGFTWLAFVGITFRIEVGVLAVIIAVVSSLGFGQYDISVNFLMLVAGTLIGALLSLLIDSYFWGELVIPELVSLYFNVFQGNSSNWGVEPFGAYFSKYLPQMFRPPVILILAVIGLSTDPADDGSPATNSKDINKKRPSRHSLKILLVSSIIYIFILSFQGHKEWRFIIYCIPLITLNSANGLSTLISRSSKSFSRQLLIVVFVLVTFVAGIVSLYMGYISSYNYPGGQALEFIRSEFADTAESLIIHMDVPTCMTGATKFGEVHNGYITYDKTELAVELSEIWKSIDILITSTPITSYNNETPNDWLQLTTIPRFIGINLNSILVTLHYHKPRELVDIVIDTVTRSLRTNDFSEIKQFIDSPIVQQDFIFVYKRKA